jgi:ethanolamine utilization protein EutA
VTVIDVDTIELTTVGIDIGSSTSHLGVAQLTLRRVSDGMLSRFIVVDRRILHQSDVILTPYAADELIDVARIKELVDATYATAGVAPADIDTGAVILTGTALERTNSEAVARLFASESGRFVCASAGHSLEALLAAHGSGAVDLSRTSDGPILHVDIGGGTTKFAYIENGSVIETAAIQVGGRLVALTDGRISRLEGAGRNLLATLGITSALGDVLDNAGLERLAEAMAEFVLDCAQGRPPRHGPLAPLVLVGAFGWSDRPVSRITFSGGVSEFLRPGATLPDDDLGGQLMNAVLAVADRRGVPVERQPLREGVRATVVGASQYSVQVSGTTVDIADSEFLPLQGVPVVRPSALFDPAHGGADIADAVKRLDLVDGETPLVISLPFAGDPSHGAMRALALSVAAGIPRSLSSEHPTIVSLTPDIGLAFGTVLKEVVTSARNVIILDGLDLRELDFVDLGEVIEPAGVVPVVVKSLAFPTG